MQTFYYKLPICVPGLLYILNIGHIDIHTVRGRGGCNGNPNQKTGGERGGHGLETAEPSSVHLLEEFVSGVFIAVILHLIQLSLLGGQHGVDLLGKMGKESLRMEHK